MNLNEVINNSKSFKDLESILIGSSGETNVEPKISFWGRRYIQAVSYSGKSGIDHLASKVIQLIIEKKFEYSPEERATGQLISREVTRLYEESDRQLRMANCFTRLLCFLRGLPDYITGQFVAPYIEKRTCSEIRWVWHEADGVCYCNAFSYYSLEQYQVQFGCLPPLLELQKYASPFKRIVPQSFQAPFLVHE